MNIGYTKKEIEDAIVSKQKADRFNKGKRRMAMIPLDCHIWEADGFAYGANKYEKDNWRKGMLVSEQMDCLMRHLTSFYFDGIDIDEESGVHHLGLAQCNLAMLVNTIQHHPELDDRFTGKVSK